MQGRRVVRPRPDTRRIKTAAIQYNANSNRMMIDDVDLHSGDPVTIIARDGSEYPARIESDEFGWYLVDYPQTGMKGRDLVGLTVKPY